MATQITISWQDIAGTIYGGHIKPLTGELIVTHKAVDMGDLNWFASNYRFNTTAAIADAKRSTHADCICPIYKPNMGAATRTSDKSICFANNGYVYVYDTTFSGDAADFKTAVTGQTLVYKLETPIEYQLTPIEIRSLFGKNNIFANCGSVTELKYTRDLNLCINDIIARIEALEGGSSNRSLSLSPTLTKSIVSDSDTAEGKTEEETKEEAQKNDEIESKR